jgi:hypothetical protein
MGSCLERGQPCVNVTKRHTNWPRLAGGISVMFLTSISRYGMYKGKATAVQLLYCIASSCCGHSSGPAGAVGSCLAQGIQVLVTFPASNLVTRKENRTTGREAVLRISTMLVWIWIRFCILIPRRVRNRILLFEIQKLSIILPVTIGGHR